MKKITKENFIERSIIKHGKIYNYSDVEFKGTKIKVKIICSEHGIFKQTPEKHMKGQGCYICGKEKFKKETIKRNKNNALNLNKEFLYKKYIEENLNQDDIANILNVSPAVISKYLKKYNIKKDEIIIYNKIKETNIERYGGIAPIHNKEIQEKIKKTNLKKYNCEYAIKNTEVRKKIKETMINKYGVDVPIKNIKIKEKIIKTLYKNYKVSAPFNSPLIKNKSQKTMLEKYGVKYAIQNKNIKEKIKKTNLKKYNCEYPVLNKNIKNKIKHKQIINGTILTIFNKTINEWSNEYNVDKKSIYHYYRQNKNLKIDDFLDFLKNHKPYITDIETIILNNLKLKKWDKKFHKNLHYKPDFKLTNNIALNVDGLYWHSEACKDNNYHFKMRQNYENLGLRIFQFRADEVYNKIEIIKSIINNALGKIEYKIDSKITKLVEISQKSAKLFLNQNHMNGYKRAKHLGLYYKNELVSIISYNLIKSSYIKIERFCSKLNYNIIGAFSKLLKAVEDEHKIKIPICYWIDLRYEVGDFLLNCKFTIKNEILGWNWTDKFNIYNKSKCMANMDKRKLTEKEYAKELKLYKIYNAGERLYVKS